MMVISKAANVLNIQLFLFFYTHPQYWLPLSVIIQHSLSSLQSFFTDRLWEEEEEEEEWGFYQLAMKSRDSLRFYTFPFLLSIRHILYVQTTAYDLKYTRM